MKIWPHERGRVFVESQSGQSRYLVDLLAFPGENADGEPDFGGQCDCKDWQTRHGPALRRGARPVDRHWCKHVRRAMYWFRHRFLVKLKEQFPDDNDEG